MLDKLFMEKKRYYSKTREVVAKPAGFEVMGKHFLYDANDMRLFCCDEAAKEKTLSSPERFITEKPQFSFYENSPKMLVLILTHRCNLRCKYCFHNQEDSKVSDDDVMDIGTLRNALKLIPVGTSLKVGFFGGEALLAFEKLKEFVAMVKSAAAFRNVDAAFSVTTNGTLLDKSKLEFLEENKFSMIVSLDGDEKLHDRMRVFADGRGSFAKIYSGLERLSKFKNLAKRTTLRATFCSEETAVMERVVYLNKVASSLGLGNVSVEPADLSEGCVKVKGGNLSVGKKLEDEYFEAAKWFVNEIKNGRYPRFHHFPVRLKRMFFRQASVSECGAGCGYLTVTPNREIYACHREGDSKIGDIANGIDEEKKSIWQDNRYYAREKCPQCFLRNICGGGCRLNSLNFNGDIRKPDPLGCAVTEICTKACAWILSELSLEQRLKYFGVRK